MTDRWLEPQNKIPFFGIIAMVIVVAVAAIFIREQLGPLFPESTVIVQEANDAPTITGRASSSFEGVREFALQHKARLQAQANTLKGTTTYTVDVPNKLLSITHGSNTEVIELQSKENLLTANVEYQEILTKVSIDAPERTITIWQPEKSVNPTTLVLGDTQSYEGAFNYRNQKYLFQYFSATDAVVITGKTTTTIPVTRKAGIITGTWIDGKYARPFTINSITLQAKIEEVY